MTDIELVVAAQVGDRGAVEALYAKYGRYVRANALRYGAGDDAEDVRQELFLRLLDGGWNVDAEHSPPDGRLQGYIKAAARMLVIQRWRSTRRVSQLPDPLDRGEQDVEDDGLAPWHLHHESPEARVLRQERLRHLKAAWAVLPPYLRRVARLRYHEGLGYLQIADRLGKKTNSIGVALVRIRERLRPALSIVYALPPPGRWGYFMVRQAPKGQRYSERQHATKRRKRAQQRRASGHAPSRDLAS